MNKVYGMILFFFLVSCHSKPEGEAATTIPVVPVTVTEADTTALSTSTDLNATTAYIVKNTIKANTTGYIENVNVASNDFVKKGRLLFSLKTREAKVLGNSINKIDPSLDFGRAIALRATADGFVSAVNVQNGDYVQEGDALAVLNDARSFAIVLSLPYEWKKAVRIGQQYESLLPDGTKLMAKAERFLPNVDPVSQTQNVLLKYEGHESIPENLVVKVKINKVAQGKTTSLPKAAVLSDETETDFWIMKMIDNHTAVKVPVQKGIETTDRVQILSPVLKPSDRILLTGNYGVADTIKVKITNR